MRNRYTTLIALIIGFAFILGACGQDSGGNETPDGSETTTSITTGPGKRSSLSSKATVPLASTRSRSRPGARSFSSR